MARLQRTRKAKPPMLKRPASGEPTMTAGMKRRATTPEIVPRAVQVRPRRGVIQLIRG
ncbi:MAG TPA: hypothetical protein VK127_03485 [Nitrososphaerales archaeon]|nr:hypothetical protein [Nitrososphaerales archaeon]